jgi:chromosome partitioning protein
MQTISIISQKGGAGKTTLALHLATAAAAAGLVTLVVDTDPQATACKWHIWRGGLEPDVIDCASHALLSRKLEQASELGADLAIIDTPPHADIMAREACRAAGLLLIPCRPRAFDLDAIQPTADLVRASNKLAFVIFMAGHTHSPLVYREAEELINIFSLTVAPVMLPERAAFHHSVGLGRTAQEIEPKGKAAKEVENLWRWTSQQLNGLTGKHMRGVA